MKPGCQHQESVRAVRLDGTPVGRYCADPECETFLPHSWNGGLIQLPRRLCDELPQYMPMD